MTEDEARDWLATSLDVSRETLARLTYFADLLTAENRAQNLVAAASLDSIWARHIVDSAQLLPLAPADGVWLDIGSGAGLPGLVIAILRDAPMILVEPRRKRAEFLATAAATLGLDHVTVEQRDIRRVNARAAVISARAVASLDALFAMAWHVPHRETRWLLPKGRNTMSELESARAAWHGVFHVEPSVTESGSMIVVASGISRKKR